MKQAQQKEATKAPRKLCLASLTVGTALAGIAGTAMLIDLRNNQAFGAKISPELGLVMALAAVALTALPAAAALLGRWDWRLKYGTAFAVTLTVLAAVSAYSEKQGAEILARQGAGDAYRQAQANAEAARKELAEANAEAATIAETATVADLEALVAHHRGLAQTEANDRGGRGKLAKGHEEAVEVALARVPAARAKAATTARATAAQARLDRAQGEIKAGPAEVSMLATVIAGRIGQAPEEIARAIALGTTLASIAVTLIMALLAEQATTLIMQGFGMSAVANGHQKPQEAATAPKRVEPFSLTAEQRLAMFIGQALRREGETTAGQLYETFSEWWRVNAPGELIPSHVALSRALEAAGITKERRAGKVRYQAMAAVH